MRKLVYVLSPVLCLTGLGISAISYSAPESEVKVVKTEGIPLRFKQGEVKHCQRYDAKLMKINDRKICVVKDTAACNKIGGKIVRDKNSSSCIIQQQVNKAVPGIEGVDIGSGGG